METNKTISGKKKQHFPPWVNINGPKNRFPKAQVCLREHVRTNSSGVHTYKHMYTHANTLLIPFGAYLPR